MFFTFASPSILILGSCARFVDSICSIVVQIMNRSNFTLIGHSQGILSSVMAQSLALSPKLRLSDWDRSADSLTFLMKMIRLNTVIGAFVAEQSASIRQITELFLPELPKGGLPLESPNRHSCLLSVDGLSMEELSKIVTTVNLECAFLLESATTESPALKEKLDGANITKATNFAAIALINSSSSMVVSGPNTVLQYLDAKIKTSYPQMDGNIARIPFSKRYLSRNHFHFFRRVKVTTDYLVISSPFHSPLLAEAKDAIINYALEHELDSCCEPLKGRPRIISPIDNSDFMELATGKEILSTMIESICCVRQDYPKNLESLDKHSIFFCFGPGSDNHATYLNSINSFRNGCLSLICGPTGFLETPAVNHVGFGFRIA